METTSKKKVKTMVVNNIYFDNDKFDLKPQEKDELNQLGKFLQDNPKALVALQGFTDNRGSAEYNMELSRQRAEAVADYLMKNFKLDPGRVVTMWYGEANPVASNDTAEGRARIAAWRLRSAGCDANSPGRVLRNGRLQGRRSRFQRGISQSRREPLDQQAIVRYLSINKQPERLPAGVLRETDKSH